jgi:hypothetical protein
VIRIGHGVHYLMTDLRGKGVDATISSDGRIAFAGGTGRFAGADRFEMTTTKGHVTETGVRAQFTGSHFPLDPTAVHPVQGSAGLAGAYQCTQVEVDPRSGTTVISAPEQLDFTVHGDTLRVADSLGNYFEGLFVSPTQVVIRLVTNGSGRRFATLRGTTSNVDLDIFGLLTFTGAGHFVLVGPEQTREPNSTFANFVPAPHGPEIQLISHLTGQLPS